MVDVTFFCSPIGLGHATRDLAISQHLDNVSLKFFTGSTAVKLFADWGLDVEDVYKLPQFEVHSGQLQNPLKWLWKYYKYYKECKEISRKILEKQKPRLVVSDEDFASLVVGQKKEIPTVLITDILETRFTKGFGSFIEKKMNKSLKGIINKCNCVILPETGHDEGNLRRVGPIVRKTQFSRVALREKFSFDKKTIVISVGGTDAGRFLIEKTVEVIPKLNEDVDFVIISGPFLKGNYGDHIRDLGFVNNLHEIIYASDLVISLAGKSTIDEAKAYGTPGIFIPIKGHFEQEDNAKKDGYAYNDIFRLKDLIKEKLSEKRNPVNADGAERAFKIIQSLLPEN